MKFSGKCVGRAVFGVTLLVVSSCHLGEDTSKESFIDDDMCGIENDHLYGLFELKNAKDGKVAKVAIEVQRQGEKITGVRVRQDGSDKVQSVQDLVTDSGDHDVIMQQEELEYLIKELAEVSEGMGRELDPLSELKQRLEIRGDKSFYDHYKFEQHYTSREREVMRDLARNSLSRDILLRAAKLSATAKATGKELTRVADRVDDSADEVNEALGKLHKSIDNVRAETQAVKDAKTALHNAAAELNIATHGLPDISTFGRSDDGKASIWVNLKKPHGEDPGMVWDIWGVEIIMGDGKVYSFDPLKTTDGGARIGVDGSDVQSRYFPSNCESNSDGGSGTP